MKNMAVALDQFWHNTNCCIEIIHSAQTDVSETPKQNSHSRSATPSGRTITIELHNVRRRAS